MSTSALRPRVLAYGDSLTAGFCDGGATFAPYGPTLARELGVGVRVHGLSGWTAGEMRAEAHNPACRVRVGPPAAGIAVAARNCTLAIVMAGTNGLGSAMASAARLQELVRDIVALHVLCHEAGCRTVCVGIPQSAFQSTFRQAADACRRVNAALEDWAAAESRATYVDCPVEYSLADGLWETDGLHMTPAGYRALALGLAPTVRGVLWTNVMK